MPLNLLVTNAIRDKQDSTGVQTFISLLFQLVHRNKSILEMDLMSGLGMQEVAETGGTQLKKLRDV